MGFLSVCPINHVPAIEISEDNMSPIDFDSLLRGSIFHSNLGSWCFLMSSMRSLRSSSVAKYKRNCSLLKDTMLVALFVCFPTVVSSVSICQEGVIHYADLGMPTQKEVLFNSVGFTLSCV